MDSIKQNSPKPISLHRVALLRPFVQFLTGVGTPVEKGMRQVGLPVYALEDMNNYVPSQRFYAFLVNMAYSQQIEDLGFRVGHLIFRGTGSLAIPRRQPNAAGPRHESDRYRASTNLQ
jgi:hypothetical protein